jgi:hypothetical protein
MTTPTIISHIEGTKYFVYTTDMIDQRIWSRGGSFPTGVDSIRDVLMVGGNVVCAVADMLDGTWGVIRSLDLVKTWATVWTHDHKIHSMRLYDHGWLLLSADDGFYQSIQSGYNFTFIATGPNARNLIYVNDVILIAHDGEQLWISIDDAVTWTMIQDLRALSPLDPIRAALAASNMYVLAGAGRKLWRSGNFGYDWEISYTFEAGEYIQSISPMETTANSTTFMLLTHRTLENRNRVYYSDNEGRNWVAKIDTEFSPYARVVTDSIKVTGESRIETTAILTGLTTPIPLTGENVKYPKIFMTADGNNWMSSNFIWPAER